MLCLTGRSGAGKTTLLRIIAGLDRADRGRVALHGHDLGEMGDSERAGLRANTIGFVFQALNLLDHLSVGENVMLPAVFADRWQGDPRQRALEVLDLVGLADRLRSMPGLLSGGERQRVALARALLVAPPLLICDEMTANLDRETAAEVNATVERIRVREGTTVLAATHDETLVNMADRVVRIEEGRLG